jgi:hypothetical protein
MRCKTHLELLDDLLAEAGLGEAPLVIMGESDRKRKLTVRQLLMTDIHKEAVFLHLSLHQ